MNKLASAEAAELMAQVVDTSDQILLLLRDSHITHGQAVLALLDSLCVIGIEGCISAEEITTVFQKAYNLYLTEEAKRISIEGN